jgi:hypothetical protein
MFSPRSGNHCLIPNNVLAFFKEILDCAPINGTVVASGGLARGLRVIVRLEVSEHETPILYKNPARKRSLMSF